MLRTNLIVSVVLLALLTLLSWIEFGNLLPVLLTVFGASLAVIVKKTSSCQKIAAGQLISILVLLMLPVIPCSSDPVDAEQAQTAASNWLAMSNNSLGDNLSTSIEDTETYCDDNGVPLYYIVNLDPEGFVIVSADDLIEPIIGFAESGRYDPSDENPLYALVNSDLPTRSAAISENAEALSTESATDDEGATDLEKQCRNAHNKWGLLTTARSTNAYSRASINDPRVSPIMLGYSWSQQGSIFNYYTPQYDDNGIVWIPGDVGNYACGCVATAVAQVMRYHQWPTSAVGTSSFEISVNGIHTTASLRGGDGYGGAYDWNNMPINPDNSTITDAQRQAIGALCYDVGVASHMQYYYSSGAYVFDAASALKNVFGYESANYETCNDTLAQYGGLMNTNLDAGYPVILGIYGDTTGHCIVADGYGYNSGTLYHHLNLGWGAYYTSCSWYNLPNIGTSYGFNTVRECISNLFPQGTGSIISGRITAPDGSPLVGAQVVARNADQQEFGTINSAGTNSAGIYAIRLPSDSAYTVSAQYSGYSFANISDSTTWSTYMGCTNRWGVNFIGGPVITSFVIGNGSQSQSRTVTLNNTCTGNPAYYMASESPDFAGAEWAAYSTAPTFTLSETYGLKTIYFKVKGSVDNVSSTVSATIIFSPNPIKYVSKSGNDSNSGLSWALAKRTVQAALNIATAGDEVWVAEGTYNESLTVPADVSIYGGFTGSETLFSQRSPNTHVTTIDGGSAQAISTEYSSSSTVIDGFTILGAGGISANGNTTISNNTINVDGTGVYAFTAINVSILNNSITGAYGIFCYYGGTTIANNLIADCAYYGVRTVYGGNIINNTIVGNNSGVLVYYSAGTIANNIIASNTTYGIYYEFYDDPEDPCIPPTLSHNCVYDNGTNYYGISPGTGDISSDPLFVNGSSGDYHLAAGSPCANTGDNTAVDSSWTDRDGNIRIRRQTVDIGAYEYEPAFTVTVSKAADQADPAYNSPVNFTVTFNWPVTSFTSSCFVVNGTANPAEATVTQTDTEGMVYNVAISGMVRNGSVSIYINRSVVTNEYGTSNPYAFCTVNYLGSPRTIFVDKNATNGTGDGLSWGNAALTITSGLSLATTGDSVWVAEGTYNESLTVPAGVSLYGGFRTSLSQRSPNTYVTTIDGGSAGAISTEYSSSSTVIDGFTILGAGGICANGNTTISNNTINVDGTGVYAFTAINVSILNNSITGAYGIFCYYGGTTIANNLITNCAYYGVRAVYSGDIINNTIVGNDSGVLVYYSGGTIANNIIASNTAYGIYYEFYDDPEDPCIPPTLSHNCVYDNGTNYYGISPGTGDISSDPLFVNGSSGDYHLAAGSPCANTGDNTAVDSSWTDRDGNIRIRRQTVDIGAYEYEPAFTVTVSKAADQADPAYNSPINFTVTFSYPVTSFTSSCLVVNGTAYATQATVIQTDTEGMVYNVAISGMTRNGSVSLYINTGAIVNEYGTSNPSASYSVTYLGSTRTIFVNKDATSGTGDGLSWDNAALTITSGLSLAAIGDSVWVAEGTYEESLTVPADVSIYGGFNGNFSQRSPNTRLTIIDGGSSAYTTISMSCSSSNAIVDGFTILGDYGGVFANNNAVISNNTIAVGTTGITVNSVTNVSILNNSITGAYGISCYYGGAIIANNVIANCTYYGIQAISAGAIINNTIVGNNSGVLVYYKAGTIANNTITSNTTYGIYYEFYDDPEDPCIPPTLSHNCVYDNGTNYYGISPGTGDISSDPLFVNGSSGDYHLAAGSPCANTGDNTAVDSSWTDRDGNTRINNQTVDIGAYEY